jgi:hypothetical protein
MRRVGTPQHWTSQLAAAIRQFLCWTFALTAFLAIQVSVRTTPHILWHPPDAARGVRLEITRILLGLLIPAQSIVFAMAWWTVWRSKVSARAWAITASLIFVLGSCLMLYSAGEIWRQAILWHVTLPLLAVGVSGLVLFSPRNLTAKLTEETPSQPPIPGDGTNVILNKMIPLLAIAGYFAGTYLWGRWVIAERFSITSPLPYYLELVLASLLVVLVHELGHAIVGTALGMKLRVFSVGPFYWHIRSGKWEFHFSLARIFNIGGATGVVPTTLEHFRANEICMIAAGPFVSLIAALLSLCAAITAPHSPWEPAWRFLSLVTTLSLLGSILNLIPFKVGAAYSDGAQIYQLLAKGPWGDYHRARSIVGSTLVTQLRPRDYDIEALQRACSLIARGQEGLLLRLYASSYYLDCGRLPEASHALSEAETIYDESGQDLPAELHSEFVFSTAYLRRDAAAARLWWQRMEAKKPTRFNVDYWLAHSALCWVENRHDEAQESWQKSFTLGQQLPKAGAYEFDRHRVTLLRHAMDESLTPQNPTPVEFLPTEAAIPSSFPEIDVKPPNPLANPAS